MKRGKKLMLLTLALALVAGASAAVLKWDPEPGGEAAGEEDKTIFSVDAGSVTKLTWTCSGDTITMVDAGDGWMYEDDRDFPLDETRLDDMLNALSEITAGKTSELRIGDETGLGGQRYLSLGDGNVYLVDASLLSSFSYGLYDMVQKEAIPSMSSIRSFVVDDGTRSFTIDYHKDSGLAYSRQYTWFAQTENGYQTLDTELTDDFIGQITDLRWGGCVDYKATSSALGEYGLDVPTVTVTVTYVETSRVETNEKDENGNTVYENRETEQTFALEMAAIPEAAAMPGSKGPGWSTSSARMCATPCFIPMPMTCCRTMCW